MHRSFVSSCAAALVLSLCSASTGEEPAASSPSATLPQAPSLLHRAQWIDVSIADGRLLAKVLKYGHGRIATESAEDEENPERESLELGSEEQHIFFRYAHEEVDREFVIRVTDERIWEIEQRSLASGQLITLRQPATGCLSLTIQQGKHSKQFRGRTLWHLLLGESPECSSAVTKLLTTVRGDLDIDERLQTIRTELCKVEAKKVPDADWTKYVAELGAEDFGTRQQADRTLRQAGRPAMLYLSRLNTAELEAEQRLRIRRILADRAPEQDDSPQLAASLVNDHVGVWLNLLDTDTAGQQERALARLEELVGRVPSINLKGTAHERRRQIASAMERYADVHR